MAQPMKFEISVRGKAATVDLSRIGPRETAIFRKHAKRNFMMILAQAEEDGIHYDDLASLWWFARYINGEHHLSLDDALDAFPSMLDAGEELEFAVIEDTDEDDDPELDDDPKE